uniref:Uncharacterized protein n=1 Tax=Romanomermis culicivorax TaxID=13658 RepID=A0A915KPE2_ROMCU
MTFGTAATAGDTVIPLCPTSSSHWIPSLATLSGQSSPSPLTTHTFYNAQLIEAKGAVGWHRAERESVDKALDINKRVRICASGTGTDEFYINIRSSSSCLTFDLSISDKKVALMPEKSPPADDGVVSFLGRTTNCFPSFKPLTETLNDISWANRRSRSKICFSFRNR